MSHVMTRWILSLGLGLGLFMPSISQAEEEARFTRGTAHTLEQGRKEMGIFGPLRLGLANDMELEVHPLFFFVAPHVAAKKTWTQVGEWTLSSRHQVIYPTLLLKAVTLEGTGGVLPPDETPPHIVSLTNQVLMSQMTGSTLVTANLGLTTAIGIGGTQFVGLELPLLWARTEPYRHTLGLRGGVQVDGAITEALGYQVRVDSFYLPGSDSPWVAEESVALTWQSASDRVGATVGVLATHGGPYGPWFWRALPKFDVAFAF